MICASNNLIKSSRISQINDQATVSVMELYKMIKFCKKISCNVYFSTHHAFRDFYQEYKSIINERERERESEAWMPERIERTIRWYRPFDRMKSIVCYMKDGIISIEKMIAARGPTINGVPVSAIA